MPSLPIHTVHSIARKHDLLTAVAIAGLALALSGCPDDDDEKAANDAGAGGGAAGQGGNAGQGGKGGSTDPEAASGLELVALYAGTWDVSGAGHSRGTVIISDDGAQFDFDTGKQFTVVGSDVYNRIPQFIATEPRVQIEIPGTPQQRLRIFVDPAATGTPLRFAYYPDAASEDNAIIATVQ